MTENSERTLKLGIISVGCLYAWADSLSVTMGNAYWSSHEFTGVVIVAMCAGRRCAVSAVRDASPQRLCVTGGEIPGKNSGVR